MDPVVLPPNAIPRNIPKISNALQYSYSNVSTQRNHPMNFSSRIYGNHLPHVLVTMRNVPSPLMSQAPHTSISPPLMSVDNYYNQQINDNESRSAMNIFKWFQTKDSNYSGGDDENITEYVIEYDLIARDSSLSQSDKRHSCTTYFVTKLSVTVSLMFMDVKTRTVKQITSKVTRSIPLPSNIRNGTKRVVCKQYKGYANYSRLNHTSLMTSLLHSLETQLTTVRPINLMNT